MPAGNLLSNDPVYRLRSPGSQLGEVASWADRLELMGGAETAVWPNYPCNIPEEVSQSCHDREVIVVTGA